VLVIIQKYRKKERCISPAEGRVRDTPFLCFVLILLIFTGLYCPDPETEINDMAQPYRRKDNTGHSYALPCHHKEAEAHNGNLFDNIR